MNCENPRFVWPDGHIISVGCGKCLACLSNKRSDWAFRIDQEYKRSKSGAFITLTYHPRFYPDDGVSKRHLQLFLKRLRKSYPNDRLRYYAVAEYGSKRGRAHYHLLLFNYSGGQRGLEEAWALKGVPIGIVDVRPVNQATIKYTLKYLVQRVGHDDKKLNKPFALMSRGYGLGLWYLTDEMVKWHRENAANYTMVHGVKGRLPRYYKKFIWPHDEVRKEVMKKSFEDQTKKMQQFDARLKEKGHDPERYRKEMRDAFNSRVKEKIAFTQKL